MTTLTQYRVELVSHDLDGDHLQQRILTPVAEAAGRMAAAWRCLPSTVRGRTEVRTTELTAEVPDWGRW